MGGKIPKNIKEKVIRQWLHGLTRERIAREDDIGAGTVTAIIQEARRPYRQLQDWKKEVHILLLIRLCHTTNPLIHSSMLGGKSS